MELNYYFQPTDLNNEEDELTKILISIICVYSKDGIPLDKIDEEFQVYCGYPIPYRKFGAESLRSWLLTLPDIYIVKDYDNNDIVIEQSRKSMHIKELIIKQRPNQTRSRKRPFNHGTSDYNVQNNRNHRRNKYQKRVEPCIPHVDDNSFLNTSLNDSANSSEKCEKFEELEAMLPLFYNHQAMGDDFFLDIADKKLGYYVPENGPKKCGLCVCGQTIGELIDRVKAAKYIAPRVVVMIGYQDLIQGKTVSNMIIDLRTLVFEMKRRNIRITLVTLIKTPNFPVGHKYKIRMDIFNSAIIDYSTDPILNCDIIDMSAIFENEMQTFRRDRDRFTRLARNDPYQVFSDYGRKVFLNALKSCLRQQLEYGH